MDIDLLARHFENGVTPLLRTDFADDLGWQRIVVEVTQEADVTGDDGGLYAPNVEPVDDHGFEGATGATLADTWTRVSVGYVLLADAQSMREAAAGERLTVDYVDLSVTVEDEAEFGDVLGRTFRCEVGEVASVEANLSIANMDFSEFADSVDDDGVFRGFPA